ncbi:SurA N-terminal domain-containing protein [Ottowia sp.]|uniref:SurA N-terminal domain-containing protein n=1 Tax=Ottowia sp. TaxID=1898956 RepID=UPI003A8C568A
MFDFIRRHTKLIMGVLFLLVIPSFALFGIEGYSSFSDNAGKVAEVNGVKISQTEWDQAHREDVESVRASNPGIDLSLLDTPTMKYASLERLVRERVLQAAAAGEHLTITDQQLAAELQRNPTIAALRQADGTLDVEQYRSLLQARGMTTEGFEAGVRAEMSSRQVLEGVVVSELISPAQADVTTNAFLERREARVQTFTPAEYAAKLQPSDADLEAYYQAHLARYQAPETANIEYVVLDLDSVKKDISINEQELRTYYDNNAPAMGKPEERRASHILINAPKDAPADERSQAKAKATELLAELRKAPDTFADVARQLSQDDVSAPEGGDLGYFQSSKGIDPTLSKVTFALGKEGDISDVVETDFGYHLVRLTGIKPADVPPFEQVRAQLEDQLRTQQAQRQFGELAETFTNSVYEQSDSLAPAAERLKLKVQTAHNVSRIPGPDAAAPLTNAKFLNALFSADALEKKHNTEAVDLGGSQLVSGRVLQHTAAHARPFAEVRDAVRAAFVADKGAETARQQGQARLKALTDQPDTASQMPAAIVLSRDAMQNQPQQVLDAVLRADPAKLPATVGVDLGAGGYAVVRVEKVMPKAEHDAELVAQSRQRYDQLWTMAEAFQYYEALKARYKVKIFAPAPSTATTLTLGGGQ